MIRLLLCSTAIAFAGPTFAQTIVPAQEPAQTIPQNAMPAAPAEPATSVAAIVDSEFPAYDGNADGQLDRSEFSKWMVALKDQEMKATGKMLPAEQVTAWASGAFTSADADKSAAVSKPELVTYLSGGAG